MRKVRQYYAVAGVFLGIVFLVYILSFYGTLDPEGRTFLVMADFFPVGAALFAVIAVSQRLLTLEKGERLKRFWTLVELSLLVWLAAETIWFVDEAVLSYTVPYPSVADLFWIAGYVPMIIAVIELVTGYKKLGLSFNWRRSAWVVPLTAATVVLVVLFVANPILFSSEATTAEKIFNPAYAFLDLLLLAPALIFALTVGGGSAGRPSIFISLGLISMSVSDIAYISLLWNGLYSVNNFIDLFWVAGYLLFGLAAAQGLRATELERRSKLVAGETT